MTARDRNGAWDVFVQRGVGTNKNKMRMDLREAYKGNEYKIWGAVVLVVLLVLAALYPGEAMVVLLVAAPS